MRTSDSNTSRQKAQIDIGLDERTKPVSRSRLEILEILNDRFAHADQTLSTGSFTSRLQVRYFCEQ
jgi:hypothetical protein